MLNISLVYVLSLIYTKILKGKVNTDGEEIHF